MKLFVSYSHGDRETVAVLTADLQRLNHAVWYDHDLYGGDEWWKTILGEIRQADAFLLALSEEAVASEACRLELRYAELVRRPVIPIIIDAGKPELLLPDQLRSRQALRYQPGSHNAAIELSRTLNGLQSGTPLPDPLPDPPSRPVSYIGAIMSQVGQPELALVDQTALLGQIATLISNESERLDLLALLRRLRTRRDLYASVRDGIDSLLHQYGNDSLDGAYSSTTAVVHHYASADEFYRAGAERAAAAKDRIYATYLRRIPPTHVKGEGAPRYFDAVLQWAQSDENHSVRRIIGRRGQDPDLLRWIDVQVDLSRSIQNYSVRLVDWPLAISSVMMALMDSDHVFLLLEADQDHKLRGVSVQSVVIAQYLHEHYSRLWDSALIP